MTVPSKNKTSQPSKDSFKKVPKTSKGEPKFNETDDGQEFLNKISIGFFFLKSFKRQSFSPKCAGFAERSNQAIRSLLRNLFLRKV